jgi:DNA-binding transcriptional LysR family regulator
VLDLRLLQHALTLARFRNFARAAEALHLTQPALSRSIAGLEASLGERLFNRTPQGAEPTAFGQMLLERAERLLAEAAALERDFQRMRGLEVGEVRVGAGAYPAEMSVVRAAGRLMGRRPKLRIQIEQGDLRALVEAVLTRRLDLAILETSLAKDDPRLEVEPLPRHRGLFFCRAGHPLVSRPPQRVEEVLAYPYAGTRLPARVARSFLSSASAGTIDPISGDFLPPVQVNSVRSAIDVVLASDAVSTSPRALIDEQVRAGALVILSLHEPWMCTAYGFVYLRGVDLSPAAEALMAEVRAIEAEVSEAPSGATVAEPAQA